MGESLIVKSKVKEFAGELSVSGNFAEALDNEVKELVKRAAKRAEENNRKTIQAKDV